MTPTSPHRATKSIHARELSIRNACQSRHYRASGRNGSVMAEWVAISSYREVMCRELSAYAGTAAARIGTVGRLPACHPAQLVSAPMVKPMSQIGVPGA